MTATLPPGPKNAGILRELPRFTRGVLPYFAGLSRRHPGPLIHIQLGPGASYLPNDPDTLREMLVRVPERMVRRRWWGELLRLVGTGLLTSDEEDWVPQRRRMRAAYHNDHRGVVEAATREEAEACAARWRAAPGAVVDAQDDVKRLLLRALVRIMFSPDVAVDERRLIDDLDVLVRYVSWRSQVVRHNLALVGLTGWGEAEMLAAAARLDAFIADLLDGCRSGHYRAGLLLAALLPAEERGEVDAENLHDEVGTLLLAGFDTTAASVTFALWLLAERPDLRARLRAEADQDDQPVTDTVLREALRLYPPVWAIHRTAGEDIELGGFTIPKGEHIMACPYAIHRNPRFWPDPDAFRPERFDGAPDNDTLLGFEYLPFSHGRHTCIGKRMAIQQARILLPLLAGEFDLERAGRLKLQPGVILKAAGGLPLRVTPTA